MKRRITVTLFFLGCILSFADDSPAPQLTLVGWGLDAKNLDTFFAGAAEVGFDELITSSTDPVFLEKAVNLGGMYNIKIFACLTPMGGIAGIWKAEHAEKPFPWQVISEEEAATVTFLSAGKNKYLVPYQWGGEPLLANEVLMNRILCFSHREGRALFETIIDRIVTVPGLEGLALDGFGYQNFHACYCAECQKKLAEYRTEHPEMSQEQSRNCFYRDALVGYINHLANYARSKNETIKTAIHIWPVFAPDPLYGNRLDLDYCGQTAAWYTLWPEEKIAEYSKIICFEAQKYYPRQEGVGMIGYYDLPGKFPVKTAECVEMELSTMIENGCRRIQVCGAGDVINNKDVAAVFKKHFK